MYISTLPSTSALDGCGWSTPRWVDSRAGVDGCGKSRLPIGIRSRTVQLVASRYTDNVIPVRDNRQFLKISVKNPGPQVAVATKFCTMARRILTWLLDFGKICARLTITIYRCQKS
jgi:hypothetical protein